MASWMCFNSMRSCLRLMTQRRVVEVPLQFARDKHANLSRPTSRRTNDRALMLCMYRRWMCDHAPRAGDQEQDHKHYKETDEGHNQAAPPHWIWNCLQVTHRLWDYFLERRTKLRKQRSIKPPKQQHGQPLESKCRNNVGDEGEFQFARKGTGTVGRGPRQV